MKKRTDIITPFEVNSNTNFASFYNMYYKRFVRYAFYYVSNIQTAEDITHDAILYYWENKDSLSYETDVLGYILLTVKNKCLNFLKHLQVETDYSKKYAELHKWEIEARIMTLEDDNYADIFTKEIIDIITKSLSKLPEQTQYIFIQNRFKYQSRKEIAAAMGVSLQKIDYHINKANNHLYKDLKDYLPVLLLLIYS
ncbi:MULTISPECIES: RNA polymerase sigma-70 factor [unclassified Parabacteroides]|uniref:RNA polymerase sigma-70 factor n=1 Tax=unclassified Parabacteroides TaxID=2649774 RepID=UPI002476AFE8|nr:MULTISPECIES: RNA polymerase sigma-70 factor [unclassified Parabacteroides]